MHFYHEHQVSTQFHSVKYRRKGNVLLLTLIKTEPFCKKGQNIPVSKPSPWTQSDVERFLPPKAPQIPGRDVLQTTQCHLGQVTCNVRASKGQDSDTRMSWEHVLPWKQTSNMCFLVHGPAKCLSHTYRGTRWYVPELRSYVNWQYSLSSWRGWTSCFRTMYKN